MLRLLLLSFLFAVPALAEVKRSASDSLAIEHKLSTRAAPAAVYGALGRIEKWWSSQHTLSGSAAHLSLKAQAGGCFCETWPEGSVEHGRVILARRDRLLRLDAALGPLQALGVTGILTFALEPKPGGAGSGLLVSYRITGDQSHDLRPIATPVDRVIGEQAARLVRFVETGKPD